MKNLLIYLNPKHSFDDDERRVETALVEIQIENSLLYWKSEDLFLVTNFEYQHKGISSIVVPDNLFCPWDTRTSKIPAIIYLLENKILTEDAWFHDFDAFQNNQFGITLKKDLGLTDYGWKEKFNTGSFFFKPSSLDIFHWIWDECKRKQANEEPILWELYKSNFNNIQSRCERLNITFNLGKRYTETTIPMADKPIKVVHFHPYWRHDRLERFKKLFLSENLIRLFDEKNPKRR